MNEYHITTRWERKRRTGCEIRNVAENIQYCDDGDGHCAVPFQRWDGVLDLIHYRERVGVSAICVNNVDQSH